MTLSDIWGSSNLLPAKLSIFILIAILALPKCGKNIYNIAKPHHPGFPLIIFNIDSRNIQSKKFVEDLFDYLNRNWLLINVGIVYSNSKVISFNGEYTIYETKIFRGQSVLRNSFNLFDNKGKLLLKGPLSEIPDSLLHQINPQYALDNRQIFDDLRKSSETIEDFNFSGCMKRNLSSSTTCFLLYDQICRCNSSVDTIMKIMEIEKNRVDVHHFIIPMFEHSQEEIALLRQNNGYTVDFIRPDATDIKIQIC